MGELGAGSGKKLARSLLLTAVSSITYVTEWTRCANKVYKIGIHGEWQSSA